MGSLRYPRSVIEPYVVGLASNIYGRAPAGKELELCIRFSTVNLEH
jgi:hypothetical protein